MNKFKNFAMFLIAAAVVFNFSLVVSAKTYNMGNLSEIYSMEDEESFECERVNNRDGVIRPIGFTEGDELGFTGWPSLAAAKAYYGLDYSYSYCGGGGSPYNYFYRFDDGSRMFFGVRP